MPNLQDLPLPLAVIVAAFWIINQNNAEFAKKLIALIAEFTSKYEALLETVLEERKASNERWLERDRQLITAVTEVKEAIVKNAHETHSLRNVVTPLVLSVEGERRRGNRSGSASRGSGGGDSDATD